MIFNLHALLAAALAATSLAATADTRSFRCKNDLVNVGDGKPSALLKCGEPLVRDAFCSPVVSSTSITTPAGPAPASTNTTNVTVTACVAVDEWTYNPGYGQFLTTLRFESGKLTSITYGDRVK